MRYYSLLIVLFLFLSGCSYDEKPQIKDRTQITHTPYIIDWMPPTKMNEMSKYYWQKEVSKKINLSECVFLFCHGNVFNETWILIPHSDSLYERKAMSVDSFLRTIRNIFPDKKIVLIVCNPGKITTSEKNVWYSKTNVWIIPDEIFERNSFLGFLTISIGQRELTINNGFDGSIEDFIKN